MILFLFLNFAHKINTSLYDNINLYEVLNVNKYSTLRDIQKSYRKASVQFKRNRHPSKRDERVWKQTQFAHDIISNPDSKDLYDNYGSLFFNKTDFTVIGYHSETELAMLRKQYKGAYLDDNFGGIINFPIQFDLVDFMNGKTKTIKMMRTVLCTCKKGGTKCPKCRKNPYEQQLITQQITLPKGASTMHRILVKDVFDTHLDRGASDVVFTAYLRKDDIFQRDGVDIKMKAHISLTDIIQGQNFTFENADGEELSISLKGVQHGEERRIKGKGIPYFGEPKMRGDVVVKFFVDFPKKLTQKQIEVVKKNLPDDIASYE